MTRYGHVHAAARWALLACPKPERTVFDDGIYVQLQWMTHTPEGSFPTVCDAQRYRTMIGEQVRLIWLCKAAPLLLASVMHADEGITSAQGGPEALAQWRALEKEMEPLQRGAALFPAAALRSDVGARRSLSLHRW